MDYDGLINYPVVNGGSELRSDLGIHIPCEMRSDSELPRVSQAHTNHIDLSTIDSTPGFFCIFIEQGSKEDPGCG